MFIFGICWFRGTIPKWSFLFCLGFYMVSHTDVRNTSTSLKFDAEYCFIFVIPFRDGFIGVFSSFCTSSSFHSGFDCQN